MQKLFDWLKTRPLWIRLLLIIPGFLVATVLLIGAIVRKPAIREPAPDPIATDLHNQSTDATDERQAADDAVSRQVGDLGHVLDDGSKTVNSGVAVLGERSTDVVTKGDSLVQSDAELIARARRESGEGTGGEGR